MMKCLAVLTFVVPSLMCLVGFFYSSVPGYSGVYYLQAIEDQVTIARDQFAIPLITAASKGDCLFAEGFVHAQDRLWSMDIMRRTAQGRLSEIFGPDALELDTFVRNIGLNRHSQRAIDEMNGSVLGDLQRYTDGINTWVKRQRSLPTEYFLTWSYFEDWRPIDSVSVSQLMGMGWGCEFLRYHLTKLVGKEMVDVMLPYDLEGQSNYSIRDEDLPKHLRTEEPLRIRKYEDKPRSGSSAHGHQEPIHPASMGNGSNSWVVSGKLTKSGKPIISNDTHLPTRIPSVWFLVTLKCKDVTVSGASFPGIPGVAIGRGNLIAWSVTMSHGDVFDLYIEKRNPANPLEYEDYTGYRPIEIFNETINVRGKDPITIVFEKTKHGPILKNYGKSPQAVGTNFIPNGIDATISLKWTLAEVKDTSIEGILSLFDVKNVSQFRAALSKIACISMGILYATVTASQVTDEIGYQLTGRIPDTSNRPYFSDAPLEGWKQENEWVGIIDFYELPYVLNPTQGFIVAANNIDYAHHRFHRVTQLLTEKISAGIKLTPEMMTSMQMDELSLIAKEIVPTILSLADAAKNSQIHARLSKWNFVMSKDSVEATMYHTLIARLMVELVEDEITNPEVLHALISSYRFADFIFSLFRHPAKDIQKDLDPLHANRWCDDIRTKTPETCSELLSRIINELNTQHFSPWGEVHEIQYAHVPFSKSKWLKLLFHKTAGVGGATDTVHSRAFSYANDFNSVHGPNVKMVMDLGTGKGYWAVETVTSTQGQSGNLFSKHYSDMTDLYLSGKLIEWKFGEGREEHVTTLKAA